MELSSASFGLSRQNLSLQKVIDYVLFFLKKNCFEKFSYNFSKKAFLNFRKQNFLIFWESYIQNPGIFRTRSIFRTRGIIRTLSNIYDGMFWAKQLPKTICSEKISYIYSRKLYLFRKGNFLIFQEMETLKNFKFQEVTF